MYEYKSSIQQIISKTENNAELKKFDRLIGNEFYKIFNISIAFKQFQSYNNELNKKNTSIDPIPFYKKLSRSIEILLITRSYRTETDRKVALWLYETILGKINRLHRDREQNLIIDLHKYMDNAQETIRNLKRIGRKKIINDYQKQYKNEFREKVTEITDLMNNDVLVAIDNAMKSLDNEIKKLIMEIQELEKTGEKHIEELKEKKVALERALVARSLFAALGIIGGVCAFAGPIGMIAGAGLMAASSIGIALTPSEGSPPSRFTIPTGVNSNINEFLTNLKTKKDAKIDQIKTIIDTLEKDVNTEIAKGTTDREKHSKTLQDIERQKNLLLAEKAKPEADQTKIDEYKKELTNLAKSKTNESKGKHDQTANIYKKAQCGLVLSETSVAAYNAIKHDVKQIEIASDSIKQAENDLEKLKVFRKSIDSTLVPMIKNCHQDLIKFEQSLVSRSSANLDVAKWKVQDTLRNFKLSLQSSVQDFKVEAGIVECVNKLMTAFDVLINLYGRIQTYAEQERFATYLTDVYTADYANMDIDNNSEFKELVTELELTLWSDVVLSQYHNIVDAFKQAVFPFANFYIDDYQLPQDVEQSKNLANLIVSAIDQIRILQSRSIEYNLTSINEHDKDIVISDFNSATARMGPFYVWRQHDHPNSINDLLSGKPIYLLANIEDKKNLNAVKFNKIGIQFRSNDLSSENRIRTILKYAEITLTHMGISYYRCGNDIYQIMHSNQTIRYTYNDGNDPTEKNSVYSKIHDGNIMLSPYTMWHIQLEGIDFTQLNELKNSIDIELYGHGTYIHRSTNICTNELRKFYKLIN